MEEPIQILTKDDAILSKIVSVVGECKIGQNKQPLYTYLIGLIIGQKIAFLKARKIRSNLYTVTGSYEFTPKDIINLTDEQLNSIDISQMAKRRILETTNYFINNNIIDHSIKMTKEFIIKLKTINGIGDWTVETLMIEYGIDMNLFPVNDKHVNRHLANLYGISVNEIDKFVDKWSPYKSIAFWYLWKYDL
jgi:DNA-3-methyladenine glycosylase II